MGVQLESILKHEVMQPFGPVAQDVILLSSSKPKWFERIATGTELDLLMLVLLFPLIAIDWMFSRVSGNDSHPQNFSGKVYCIRTTDKLLFVSKNPAKSNSILETMIQHERSLKELVDIEFDHAHQTLVRFEFRNSDPIEYYFSGVWSDLAGFRANSLSNA